MRLLALQTAGTNVTREEVSGTGAKCPKRSEDRRVDIPGPRNQTSACVSMFHHISIFPPSMLVVPMMAGASMRFILIKRRRTRAARAQEESQNIHSYQRRAGQTTQRKSGHAISFHFVISLLCIKSPRCMHLQNHIVVKPTRAVPQCRPRKIPKSFISTQILFLFPSPPLPPPPSSSAALFRSSSLHPCPLLTTGVWKLSGLGSMFESPERPNPHSG